MKTWLARRLAVHSRGGFTASHALCAALIIVSIALYGCATYEEVSRVTSPDGIVDVVVVLVNPGATSGYSQRIYIVPKGEPRKDEHEVFVADCTKDLKTVWRDVRELELRFDEARIFQFKNFWRTKSIQDFRYVVEIVLAHPPGRVLGC